MKMAKKALLVGMATLGLNASALAQNDVAEMNRLPAKLESEAVTVIGQVTEVWAKDGRYDAFHSKLMKDIKGVPDLGDFKANQQWVTVIGARSNITPIVVKGWATVQLNAELGDIVEMRAGAKEAKEYGQLGQVARIICKRTAADYKACAAANPLQVKNAAGQSIAVQATF